MTSPSDPQRVIDEIAAAIESGQLDIRDGTIIPDDEVDRMFGIVRHNGARERNPNPAA